MNNHGTLNSRRGKPTIWLLIQFFKEEFVASKQMMDNIRLNQNVIRQWLQNRNKKMTERRVKYMHALENNEVQLGPYMQQQGFLATKNFTHTHVTRQDIKHAVLQAKRKKLKKDAPKSAQQDQDEAVLESGSGDVQRKRKQRQKPDRKTPSPPTKKTKPAKHYLYASKRGGSKRKVQHQKTPSPPNPVRHAPPKKKPTAKSNPSK